MPESGATPRPGRPAPLDRLALALATLGPCGLSPFAPGTVGSAAATLAAPFCLLPLPAPGRAAALALVLGLGTWAASRAEIALGRKDPGCVVVDELLGQWTALAFFFLPGQNRAHALELAALFFLFRLFDILKPWPVRAIERNTPGGLGIMFDDLAAGLLAALAYALLRPLF